MRLKFAMLCVALLFSCRHDMPTPPGNGQEGQLPQWPMFRHDVRHTGNINTHPYEGIVGPEGPTVSVKWTFDTGGLITGSPAIDKDGTIFFATSRPRFDSLFYALNSDGTLKWKYNILPTKHWSSPAIAADGTVYYVTELGTYAFRPDGTLKWEIPVTSLGSSPALGPDGTIYFTGYRNLFAINPDGTIKWQLESGTNSEFHFPVIAKDGTIYFNQVGGTIVAVNPDGKMKWEYADTTKFNFYSAVIDGDGSVYFITTGETLYALDSAGQLKWKIAGIGSISLINVPAIAPNHTIFVVDKSYLYAFLPHGEIKWKTKERHISAPPVVDAAGNVYLVHSVFRDSTVITCYGNDGVLKWRFSKTPRGTITGGAPLGADGTLYFGFYNGEDHNLYAIY